MEDANGDISAAASSAATAGDLYVGNEFAKLRLGVRRVGNGLRLEIEDVLTGISAELDPLELLGIAWSSADERYCFVNPATMSRWRAEAE